MIKYHTTILCVLATATFISGATLPYSNMEDDSDSDSECSEEQFDDDVQPNWKADNSADAKRGGDALRTLDGSQTEFGNAGEHDESFTVPRGKQLKGKSNGQGKEGQTGDENKSKSSEENKTIEGESDQQNSAVIGISHTEFGNAEEHDESFTVPRGKQLKGKSNGQGKEGLNKWSDQAKESLGTEKWANAKRIGHDMKKNGGSNDASDKPDFIHKGETDSSGDENKSKSSEENKTIEGESDQQNSAVIGISHTEFGNAEEHDESFTVPRGKQLKGKSNGQGKEGLNKWSDQAKESLGTEKWANAKRIGHDMKKNGGSNDASDKPDFIHKGETDSSGDENKSKSSEENKTIEGESDQQNSAVIGISHTEFGNAEEHDESFTVPRGKQLKGKSNGQGKEGLNKWSDQAKESLGTEKWANAKRIGHDMKKNGGSNDASDKPDFIHKGETDSSGDKNKSKSSEENKTIEGESDQQNSAVIGISHTEFGNAEEHDESFTVPRGKQLKGKSNGQGKEGLNKWSDLAKESLGAEKWANAKRIGHDMKKNGGSNDASDKPDFIHKEESDSSGDENKSKSSEENKTIEGESDQQHSAVIGISHTELGNAEEHDESFTVPRGKQLKGKSNGQGKEGLNKRSDLAKESLGAEKWANAKRIGHDMKKNGGSNDASDKPDFIHKGETDSSGDENKSKSSEENKTIEGESDQQNSAVIGISHTEFGNAEEHDESFTVPRGKQLKGKSNGQGKEGLNKWSDLAKESLGAEKWANAKRIGHDMKKNGGSNDASDKPDFIHKGETDSSGDENKSKSSEENKTIEGESDQQNSAVIGISHTEFGNAEEHDESFTVPRGKQLKGKSNGQGKEGLNKWSDLAKESLGAEKWANAKRIGHDMKKNGGSNDASDKPDFIHKEESDSSGDENKSKSSEENKTIEGESDQQHSAVIGISHTELGNAEEHDESFTVPRGKQLKGKSNGQGKEGLNKWSDLAKESLGAEKWANAKRIGHDMKKNGGSNDASDKPDFIHKGETDSSGDENKSKSSEENKTIEGESDQQNSAVIGISHTEFGNAEEHDESFTVPRGKQLKGKSNGQGKEGLNKWSDLAKESLGAEKWANAKRIGHDMKKNGGSNDASDKPDFIHKGETDSSGDENKSKSSEENKTIEGESDQQNSAVIGISHTEFGNAEEHDESFTVPRGKQLKGKSNGQGKEGLNKWSDLAKESLGAEKWANAKRIGHDMKKNGGSNDASDKPDFIHKEESDSSGDENKSKSSEENKTIEGESDQQHSAVIGISHTELGNAEEHDESFTVPRGKQLKGKSNGQGKEGLNKWSDLAKESLGAEKWANAKRIGHDMKKNGGSNDASDKPDFIHKGETDSSGDENKSKSSEENKTIEGESDQQHSAVIGISHTELGNAEEHDESFTVPRGKQLKGKSNGQGKEGLNKWSNLAKESLGAEKWANAKRIGHDIKRNGGSNDASDKPDFIHKGETDSSGDENKSKSSEENKTIEGESDQQNSAVIGISHTEFGNAGEHDESFTVPRGKQLKGKRNGQGKEDLNKWSDLGKNGFGAAKLAKGKSVGHAIKKCSKLRKRYHGA